MRYLSQRFIRWFRHLGVLGLIMSISLIASTQSVAAANYDVKVVAKGSGFEVQATAPFGVTWDLYMSTASIVTSPAPPHFPTGGTLPPRVKHLSSNGVQQAAFNATFTELAPHQTFNFIVRAGTSYMTRTATTLVSSVTVHFDQIVVTDDSDVFSGGDLNFYMYSDKNSAGEWPSADNAINSGDTIQLPHGDRVDRTVSYNPSFNNIKVSVEGVDNDCDFLEACPTSPWIEMDGSGSDTIFDWSTVVLPISLGKFAGLQNLATGQFIMESSQDYSLKFKVFFTVTVSYGEAPAPIP